MVTVCKSTWIEPSPFLANLCTQILKSFNWNSLWVLFLSEVMDLFFPLKTRINCFCNYPLVLHLTFFQTPPSRVANWPDKFLNEDFWAAVMLIVMGKLFYGFAPFLYAWMVFQKTISYRNSRAKEFGILDEKPLGIIDTSCKWFDGWRQKQGNEN